MKRVLDDIIVMAIGSKEWKLMDDFEYHVGFASSLEVIVIPTGFETDFASIPKVFHSFINPAGKVRAAALVHDYLYSKRGVLPHKTYTRKECDEIFLELMQVVGVAYWKSLTMYYAVWLFGKSSWNADSK